MRKLHISAKIMQEMYCFLEIFTQLATILHDCRPASTIAFNWFCLWRWQYFFSPCKGTSAHRASSGRCRWHSDKVRHLPRPLGIGVKWHYIPTLQFVYHSHLWQVFHVDFYLHLCLQKVWNLITGGAEVPFYWAGGVVGVPGAQH